MIKTSYAIIFLSVLSTLYSILNIGLSVFGFLYALPLALATFTIIFNYLFEDYANSNVFKVFILQAVIRYCLLPTILSTGQEFKVGYNSIFLNTAIIIMVVELFFSFLILAIFSKHQNKFFSKRLEYIKPLKNLILVSIMLTGMFVILYISNTLDSVNAIWNLADHVDKYINENEELHLSTAAVLYTPFRVIAALFFISIIYKSQKIKEKNKKWFYLLIILISNIFIFGVSRFNIILFTVPLLVLVTNLINKNESRKVIVLSVIGLVFAIVSASIAKFSRYGNEFELNSLFTASSVNAYFAGPGNIAVGIEASNSISFYDSLMYFMNDTLQNIPILSKITNPEYKSTVVYNEFIYGHQLYADQIVPLSISGLFHFGTIGIFIYSSLFLSLALYMERLSYRVCNIGYKYILISLSLTLSLVFMLNIGSFYATLFRSFTFVFLPIFLLTKFPRMRV